jgi:hypothetical protein
VARQRHPRRWILEGVAAPARQQRAQLDAPDRCRQTRHRQLDAALLGRQSQRHEALEVDDLRLGARAKRNGHAVGEAARNDGRAIALHRQQLEAGRQAHVELQEAARPHLHPAAVGGAPGLAGQHVEAQAVDLRGQHLTAFGPRDRPAWRVGGVGDDQHGRRGGCQRLRQRGALLRMRRAAARHLRHLGQAPGSGHGHGVTRALGALDPQHRGRELRPRLGREHHVQGQAAGQRGEGCDEQHALLHVPAGHRVPAHPLHLEAGGQAQPHVAQLALRHLCLHPGLDVGARAREARQARGAGREAQRQAAALGALGLAQEPGLEARPGSADEGVTAGRGLAAGERALDEHDLPTSGRPEQTRHHRSGQRHVERARRPRGGRVFRQRQHRLQPHLVASAAADDERPAGLGPDPALERGETGGGELPGRRQRERQPAAAVERQRQPLRDARGVTGRHHLDLGRFKGERDRRRGLG